LKQLDQSTHPGSTFSHRPDYLILIVISNFVVNSYIVADIADSPLLVVLLHFMSLKLVANQRTRPQAQQAAHRRASPRMADGAANNAARRSATERTYTGSLFPRR
jgi:hypothetical protein